MREFLKGLELDKDKIDTIMAEYGKSVQSYKEQIEELKGKEESYKENEQSYKNKIDELSQISNDSQKIQQELDTLKKEIAEKEANEKARKDDEMLTNNIMNAIGDKQFVNEYTKNAIINDIKTALESNFSKLENLGKDLYPDDDSLWKDFEI